MRLPSIDSSRPSELRTRWFRTRWFRTRLHWSLGALCAIAVSSCSAGGTGGDPGASLAAGPGTLAPGSGSSGDGSRGSAPGGDFLVEDEALALDADGNPVNIGSEVACDGIDENGNGIIDDVDKGRDGLCDCLKIGFLGALASDAGNQTGAFEAWLEARSDVPVTHVDANARLSAESFEGLQVVVVGNLAQRASSGGYAPEEVAALADWVSVQGGGAITLAGYTNRETDVVPTNQLLEPAGLAYDYAGRGAGVLGVGAPPVIVRGIVNPEHPSVEGISALGVYAAYPVVGDGDVIVREGELNLAMAKASGEGRVFAFSDEWITQDALWQPMTNRPRTPCQQQCAQCTMQCTSCESQCAACQLEPCQGGAEPARDGSCARGCDQACEACSQNCAGCEQSCQACSALEEDDRLDIPRFWLNVIRWLTPENECQVPPPPPTVY